LDRLAPGPVMIEDPKLRWPAQLSVGPDGIGNSMEYVKHIMEESMEALINHFKIVTQGFRVPAGEVYQPVESPRGELGFYVVSNGGTRPYRVHIRDPSFVNLQATPMMVEGGLVADVVGPVLSEASRGIATQIMARYPTARSALIPLLYLVQSEVGWVPRQGMREVAEILGLTTAEVEAVATFYTMLKLHRCGRYVL